MSKEIVSKIEVGMSEKDIEDTASEVFLAYNVRQHWHRPIIGVGEGSTKLSSVHALASSFLTEHKRILQEDDLVLIDIAPVYMTTYAGDYTTTHVFGNNPELEALVAYARDISRKIAEYASNEMIVTDVFRYAQELIRTISNYTRLYPPLISLRHRLSRIHPLENLPEPGLSYLILKKFPFIDSSNLTPMDELWVVEPYLMHKERAAKFEELVFVSRKSVILDRDY
ncbi:aminopeptidase P family protein [Candidatus Methanoperedens nitratireducens]|uniref:aminopeptidase P family protein n=1 Tax=Candidatus Methanoperedens nitratireducens TaxID=1392998 RepID=UPI00211D12B1|nr:aminopeptidase P family protein [Candidatus Methanoperedens nitroreducens]